MLPMRKINKPTMECPFCKKPYKIRKYFEKHIAEKHNSPNERIIKENARNAILSQILDSQIENSSSVSQELSLYSNGDSGYQSSPSRLSTSTNDSESVDEMLDAESCLQLLSSMKKCEPTEQLQIAVSLKYSPKFSFVDMLLTKTVQFQYFLTFCYSQFLPPFKSYFDTTRPNENSSLYLDSDDPSSLMNKSNLPAIQEQADSINTKENYFRQISNPSNFQSSLTFPKVSNASSHNLSHITKSSQTNILHVLPNFSEDSSSSDLEPIDLSQKSVSAHGISSSAIAGEIQQHHKNNLPCNNISKQNNSNNGKKYVSGNNAGKPNISVLKNVSNGIGYTGHSQHNGHALQNGHPPHNVHSPRKGHSQQNGRSAQNGYSLQNGQSPYNVHIPQNGYSPRYGRSARNGHAPRYGRSAQNSHSSQNYHSLQNGHSSQNYHSSQNGHSSQNYHLPNSSILQHNDHSSYNVHYSGNMNPYVQNYDSYNNNNNNNNNNVYNVQNWQQQPHQNNNLMNFYNILNWQQQLYQNSNTMMQYPPPLLSEPQSSNNTHPLL